MKNLLLSISLFSSILGYSQTIPTSTVTGSLKINDSLNVTNNINTLGNLNASGESTLQDTVHIQKDLIVDGDVKIAGKLKVTSGAKITGGLTLSGIPTTMATMDPCVFTALAMDASTGNVLTLSPASAMAMETIATAASLTTSPCGSSSSLPVIPFTWQTTGNHVNNNNRWIGTYENYDFNIRTNSILRMVVKNNGQVFIGAKKPTNAPYNTAALGVDGMFVTREIYVCDQISAGWADYVFKSDYKLMPLQIVKNYVDKNAHLPNIPSADEIKTDGQNVGKLQVLQMEKIEEIYLYLFDITKKLEQLEKENAELKKALYEKK